MIAVAPAGVAELVDQLDDHDVYILAKYSGAGTWAPGPSGTWVAPWESLGLDPRAWLTLVLGPRPELPAEPDQDPSTDADQADTEAERRPVLVPALYGPPATRDVGTCATPTRGPTGTRERPPAGDRGALNRPSISAAKP